MSVNLEKGGRVNLSKEAGGSLVNLLIGLGWNPRKTSGEAWDLDASLFVLNDKDKVLSEKHFVYYNNKSTPNGAVVHTGDNQTGEGDNDDEQIKINLSQVEAEAQKIAIVVTIHKAAERGQNFGQVDDAFIRAVDEAANKELARFDLSDASSNTAVLFGELYRKGADWSFRAVGDGHTTGLQGFVDTYM